MGAVEIFGPDEGVTRFTRGEVTSNNLLAPNDVVSSFYFLSSELFHLWRLTRFFRARKYTVIKADSSDDKGMEDGSTQVSPSIRYSNRLLTKASKIPWTKNQTTTELNAEHFAIIPTAVLRSCIRSLLKATSGTVVPSTASGKSRFVRFSWIGRCLKRLKNFSAQSRLARNTGGSGGMSLLDSRWNWVQNGNTPRSMQCRFSTRFCFTRYTLYLSVLPSILPANSSK